MNIQYTWSAFTDLSRHDLYDILRLRQQVFIIEQASLYPDIDGNDPIGLHLTAREDDDNLVGCLRLLPPGTTNHRPAIGRLAIAEPFRGLKMGIRLMEAGIRKAGELYAGSAIYISAQEHLAPFYGELGFLPRGEPYDEDGILHIDMIRPMSGAV
ncbi:MAG: GNAT family N-acetyltransferase [Desulfobacterales bacterium]|nr:GNAT family N-acetyltransferase [Desulfobacterales bacterium]